MPLDLEHHQFKQDKPRCKGCANPNCGTCDICGHGPLHASHHPPSDMDRIVSAVERMAAAAELLAEYQPCVVVHYRCVACSREFDRIYAQNQPVEVQMVCIICFQPNKAYQHDVALPVS